jgi:hypothetical protein
VLKGNANTRGEVTVPAGATSASYTFTAGYTAAPKVVLTPVGTTPPTGNYSVSNITTSGFTVNLSVSQAGDTTFQFQAQQ